MVEEFYRQEREYEAFIRGGGFVCNGLGMGPEWHRVHRADCNALNHAGPARPGARTTVRKACSRRLADLERWLVERFGGEGIGFRYCAFCDPREGLTGGAGNGPRTSS
jgi:hypothetical protein